MVHKSRLGTLVIDCQTEDLSGDADFWSAALGGDKARSDDRYVWLSNQPGDTQVILQKVEHPSRVHIDIETDDIAAEVARLSDLGARVVERLERWVVMEAPSGHRFCVIGPVSSDFEQKANAWT